VRSVIAVSIDGSITVLKPCETTAFHLMRWIQEYWVCELRQYQPILGRAESQNLNALNLDTLAFLVDRLNPRMTAPLSDVPEEFRNELDVFTFGGETVDLVTAVRCFLNKEFGGIIL